MKKDQIYLYHIRDALERVESYCEQGEADFMTDPKTQDAVIRNLEVIGEACKNISEDFKEKHSDFPWRNLAGLRDKLIHHYFGVSLRLFYLPLDSASSAE